MAASAPTATAPRFRFRLRREYGLLVLLVLVMVDLSRTIPATAFSDNLWGVLRNQAHLGVLAVGMTLVILTGGIDLSVGSIVALAGVSMGIAWKATGSP